MKIYNRDVLLETTTQLFWRKGLSETSLADIEKSTGVNKSSLYSEFADKDDMFVACIEHYIKNNGVYELLDRKPLGRGNLIDFLKLGKSCEGQRGCFVVNSVRESAILPEKAKNLIKAHFRKVRAKVISNIEASSYIGDASTCADLILTFNSGLCIELNATKDSPLEKINAFVKVLGL